MATVSVAIAVRDEVEDWRKKQGDIINLHEGGFQWGPSVVKNHLIVEVSMPAQATMEKCQALLSRYYANGVLNWDGESEVMAKRRFKLDWVKLKTIISQAGITVDWQKVEDVTVAYQPLSQQENAPGGTIALLDPTKLIFDKYENRLIKAIDFTNWIVS